MRARLSPSRLRPVPAVVAVAALAALAAPPAAAAGRGRVVASHSHVSYSPGLDRQFAANQTVHVVTPWWFSVARGDFRCATVDGGQAHFDVDAAWWWFWGTSVVPETLQSGHGAFVDAWMSFNGAAKVVYADRTVVYHGTSTASFENIVGATYNRVATSMQIHVPATTVTLYAGNDVLTCLGVTADLGTVGAPTGFDADNKLTDFAGPATVDFS